MGVLDFELPQESQPQQIVRPAQRWLDRGLRSAYLLQPGIWDINLVDGSRGGSQVGAGITFVNGELRTPNVAGSGALLKHGLDVNVLAPFALVVGWKTVAGSVAWCLLRTGIANFYGWYGTPTGDVASANNNVFDGFISTGATRSVAFRYQNDGELVGFSNSGLKTVDSATTAPQLVNADDIVLGYARRNLNSSPAEALFSHLYAFQGELTDSELFELAVSPQRLWEDQQIYIPTFAAPAFPTITLPRAKAGSATPTGFVPQWTAS